jgi:hypothetical protein
MLLGERVTGEQPPDRVAIGREDDRPHRARPDGERGAEALVCRARELRVAQSPQHGLRRAWQSRPGWER